MVHTKAGLSDFDPVKYVSTTELQSEHYSPSNFYNMGSGPGRKDDQASGPQ